MLALWGIGKYGPKKDKLSSKIVKGFFFVFMLLFFLDLVNKLCLKDIKYPETKLKLPPLYPHQPLEIGFLCMWEKMKHTAFYISIIFTE